MVGAAHTARVLAVLLGLLVPWAAHAASAALQLDTERIAVGQAIGLSVVVQDAQPRGVPTVSGPDGVTLTYTGQSSTTNILNGRVQSFVKFRYQVAADREGTFVLGPAAVTVTDRTGRTFDAATGTVELVVEAGAGGMGSAVEVHSSFDVLRAWQGQVVIYRYGLRSRRQIAGGRWFGHPSEGLLLPRDGRPERREYRVQDAAGPIQVDEVTQPFVVTRAGALRWEAPAVELDLVAEGGPRSAFRLFQRTERFVVAGQPLTLDVAPLPPPPPGFSGLVGDFQLSSRLAAPQTRVGESVVWRVDLSGTGSVEGYSLPEPPEVEGARIYEGDASARAVLHDDRFTSAVTFERTVVATREGTVTLPPLEVIVFSTTEGRYVTLRTGAATLVVRPGEDGAVELQSFAPEPGFFDDPQEEGPRPAWTRGPDHRWPWLEAMPWALAAAAAPALVLSGGVAAGAARRAAEARRRAQPVREATPLERLDALPSAPEDRLAALDAALRLALARRVAVAPAQLDRDAVTAALPAELAEEVSHLTRELDRARFAGFAPADDLEPRLRRAVERLEAR